jgi:hypothetical protein
MPVKADVIRLAYQRLGMGISGDIVNGSEYTIASDILDSIFPDDLTWDLTAVPQLALEPLATFLAAHVAPQFAVAPPMTVGRALVRFQAVAYPDDRTAADPVFY